jgi:hypothetical protein
MLNPKDASKSPLSSRIALSLALLLAGIFGLAAAILLPAPSLKKIAVAPQPAPAPSTARTVVADPPAASPDALIEFCSQHVSERRSFVLFRRGTCVVVDEPCADPLAEARKRLSNCAQTDARFVPEPTSEGDLIVTFKEPVFHRFTKDELADLGPWLDQVAPTLLSPAESTSTPEGWAPHPNAKVGLLARRRLLEDASNAVPFKIIRAKSRATAAR